VSFAGIQKWQTTGLLFGERALSGTRVFHVFHVFHARKEKKGEEKSEREREEETATQFLASSIPPLRLSSLFPAGRVALLSGSKRASRRSFSPLFFFLIIKTGFSQQHSLPFRSNWNFNLFHLFI